LSKTDLFAEDMGGMVAGKSSRLTLLDLTIQSVYGMGGVVGGEKAAWLGHDTGFRDDDDDDRTRASRLVGNDGVGLPYGRIGWVPHLVGSFGSCPFLGVLGCSVALDG